MNRYEGLELRKRYLIRLQEIHVTYIAHKATLSWLDVQRIEKLARRIMRLLNRLETLPQYKLTKKELRRAQKESQVIAEMLQELTNWVAEASTRKPVKRIQRSRS